MSARLRYLARQFRMPSGWIGRRLIAPWLDRISREANARALAALALGKDEAVLEIGFGGGALLSAMLRTGASVTGADPSPDLLARARRRFAREIAAGRLHVVAGEAIALPLEDTRFDKAVSVNSLYFWGDLDRAFAELARLLRPNGLLVLGFESPEILRRWPGHVHGFAVLSAADVTQAALRLGFSSLGCDERGGFLVLSLRRGADMEAV